MFCDIQHFSGEPFDGDPRYVLQAQPRAGPGEGLHVLRRRPRWSSSTSSPPTSPSRSTTPATSTSPPHDIGVASCASRRPHARGDGHPGRVLASTRTARASTRSTCATPTRSTMADNVMTFRLVVKEVAQRPRRVRDVHAEADRRRVRLGDAHAPLAVRGRRQRVPRPGDEYGLSKVGKHFIAGLLAPRARDHRDHQPVGQLLQAARSPATRRRCTCAGPATTARRSCACRCRSGARTSSTRIEFRAPDPACNPYLAFSVMLAAGLKGIEEGYDAPARGHRTTSTR